MVAARCQRFYGAGDPTVWFKIPLGHLAFFVSEIEGLQAEESLRRVKETRIAFASKGEGGDSARQAEQEWAEKARRADREPPQERPKMTKAEYDATLAMVGCQSQGMGGGGQWVVTPKGGAGDPMAEIIGEAQLELSTDDSKLVQQV